jgi:hypothetical protein
MPSHSRENLNQASYKLNIKYAKIKLSIQTILQYSSVCPYDSLSIKIIKLIPSSKEAYCVLVSDALAHLGENLQLHKTLYFIKHS